MTEEVQILLELARANPELKGDNEIREFNDSITNSDLTEESIIRIANENDFACRVVSDIANDLFLNETYALCVGKDKRPFLAAKYSANKIARYYVNRVPEIVRLKEFIADPPPTAISLLPVSDHEGISSFTADSSISEILRSFRGIVPAIGLIIILASGSQILALLLPFYSQLAIDRVLPEQSTELLSTLFAVFVGVTLVIAIMETFHGWVSVKISTKLLYRFNTNVVHRLLRLPQTFFDQHHLGDILSKMSSVNAIESSITQQISQVIIASVSAMLLIIVLFWYHATLTLMVLFFVFVRASVVPPISKYLRTIQTKELEANAEERSQIIETLQSLSTIKTHNLESFRQSKWQNLKFKALSLALQHRFATNLQSVFNTTLSSLQYITVIYFGVSEIIDDKITLGMLMAFIALQASFSMRTTSILLFMTQLKILKTYFERLADISATQREYPSHQEPFARLPNPPMLELAAVTFGYIKEGNLVLNDLNLRIEPGELIGIKGKSGHGKTTLLKLLAGLYLPQSGQILVDNKLLEYKWIEQWRRSIAVVMQHEFLFSGTIYENIAFGQSEVDHSWAEVCADMAQVKSEIQLMSNGFETIVDSAGSNLSSGQKQRLLLARAFYRRPSVMLLDEAAANIDIKTQLMISDIIGNLECTRIVVSHSEEMLLHADKVFELVDGKLQQVES